MRVVETVNQPSLGSFRLRKRLWRDKMADTVGEYAILNSHLQLSRIYSRLNFQN